MFITTFIVLSNVVKASASYEKNEIKCMEDYMLCGNRNEEKILKEYFELLKVIRVNLSKFD